MLNREQIRASFRKYTDLFDASDEKIRLKIFHTYRVAAVTDQIAADLGLSKEDADLAWGIGMLHDIGRFEQIRRYQTFYDSLSVDHAEFGADLLFKEKLIELFFPDGISEENSTVIETAIREHNKYRVREGLAKRQQLFCDIIRDADKVDILRVNVETPMEVIYGVTMKELKKSTVSPEVMQCFNERRCVPRDARKTAIDNLVSHIALVFELVFPVSRRIADTQGWIYRMMDFESEHPDTQQILSDMRGEIKSWLSGLV